MTGPKRESPSPHVHEAQTVLAQDQAQEKETVHAGTTEAETDLYNVAWNGNEDVLNPKNWSARSRWVQLTILGLLNFVTCLSSSMLAPALSSLVSDLDTHNSALTSLSLSIYVVGFALGPLITAPLSEMYGRIIVYHISSFLFLAFTSASAASSNIGMFVAFRFFAGCVGITPAALLGGSIGDLMPPSSMGKATGSIAIGSLIAPLIAPVIGGYLSEYAGWRWVLWLNTILYGAIAFPSLFILRETYAPILLSRKARRLRRETGDSRYRYCLDSNTSRAVAFKEALIRPLQFLVTSPIVFILSWEVAIVYGVQYLVFTTLALVFEQRYQFSAGSAGLTYLGDGIGAIAGVFATAMAMDKIAKKKASIDTQSAPEKVLWLLIPAGILVPAGLFWYGWSVEAKSFWLVPLIGLGVFGFAIMAVFMPVQVYLIRAFDHHSTSALAANNLLRSILGAVLPLAGLDMYATLGYGWGNSLLAFVSLATIPPTLLLVYRGGNMREKDHNIPNICS
ncbi:MFS transporter prlG [Metarhizium anisopliae]|nr:MFS transporter prlG [Metarhizium anisopliae]